MEGEPGSTTVFSESRIWLAGYETFCAVFLRVQGSDSEQGEEEAEDADDEYECECSVCQANRPQDQGELLIHSELQVHTVTPVFER